MEAYRLIITEKVKLLVKSRTLEELQFELKSASAATISAYRAVSEAEKAINVANAYLANAKVNLDNAKESSTIASAAVELKETT